MRDTQSKVEDALAKVAKERMLEMVKDSDWANTGTYRFQRFDDFTSIVTLKYDFQKTYNHFWIDPGNTVSNVDPEMIRAKPEEMGEKVVDRIAALLDERVPERKPMRAR